MNATAIKPYTAATCKRIVAACEKELASRNTAPPAWQYAGEMSFRAGLREVIYSASSVLGLIAGWDGFDGAHDELHAALVDLDSHSIWESAA
jgi:hypothetical protein